MINLSFRWYGRTKVIRSSWYQEAGLYWFYSHWETNHEEVNSLSSFCACSVHKLTPFHLLAKISLKSRSLFIYSNHLCWNWNVIFLYSCAVSNLKKVSLELGGKSPLIIFSDCDMDKAVRMVRITLCNQYLLWIFLYYLYKNVSIFPSICYNYFTLSQIKARQRQDVCFLIRKFELCTLKCLIDILKWLIYW